MQGLFVVRRCSDLRRVIAIGVTVVATMALVAAPASAEPAGAHGEDARLAFGAETFSAGGPQSQSDGYSCAVKSDGTPYCWGSGVYGQTTLPAGLGKVTSISAGAYNACAVKVDATVACWGLSGPTLSPPAGSFVSITTGQQHACAIRTDGGVTCWGFSLSLWNVPGGTFTAVSAGEYKTCGIRTDGGVTCWGYYASAFGDAVPPADLGAVTAISVGDSHACAVRVNGTARCWGQNNGGGDLGITPGGTFSSISAGAVTSCGVRTDAAVMCWGPGNGSGVSNVPGGFGPAIAVSAGNYHACAVRANGTIGCWGDNSRGQGNAPGALGAVAAPRISAGGAHSCVVKPDRTAACFGSDSAGQRTLPAGLGTITSISAGGLHSCAVRTDQTAACWGSDAAGQRTLPAGLGTVGSISAGAQHSCAIKSDATAVCWGSDGDGQRAAPAGLYSMVSAGLKHTCAVQTDGTAVCWGSDADGQRSVPAALGPVTAIAAGAGHTCAVKTNGDVACWGATGAGQSTPPAGPFVSVTAGAAHSCGISAAGVAQCWGSQTDGRSTVPASLGAVVGLSAGDAHTCAYGVDAVPVCWGDSSSAQTGAAPAAPGPAPPNGTRSVPYSHTFTSELGSPPATLSVSGGALPNGLTLSAAGVLSGTPTSAGIFTFTVLADNGLFATTQTQFSVIIRANPTLATSQSGNRALGAGTLADTATLSGLLLPNDAGGTVDFRLYGPDDATCAQTPVFVSLGHALPLNGSSVTSAQFTPTQPGTYRWIAAYSGDAKNTPVSGACNDAGETSVVSRAPATIATIASAGITVGSGTLADTATVGGRYSPVEGATIDFRLYGPNDATCSQAPVFESLGVAYSAAGGTASSSAYTPTTAGTYRWRASYSGDVNNAPVTGACNAANESAVVARVVPTIATTASAGVVLGAGTVQDTATVSARHNPQAGATIDFRLYGPGDAACTGTPVFQSLNVTGYPVGGGPVTSAAYTPTAAGTYRWRATYTGDVNNQPVTGACNAADETVTVTRATPTITTSAAPNATMGADTLVDTATVSQRSHPVAGATIDFRLYGPDDATCAAAPVFESLNVPYPVGGGTVASAPYSATQPGTYRWVAAYSGESNNAPAAGVCNDADETTVVARAQPTIATTASAAITLGAGALTDAVTVSGRVNPQPGATVDFRLYGPGDSTCTGEPLFSSTSVAYPVAGGAVTSAAYTPTSAGTYRWVAAYSGEANNAPQTGACNDAGESTVVARAAPAIATSASPDMALASGTLTDTATISARVSPQPGATVDFRLYGPGDADCSDAPVFKSLDVAYPVGGGPVTSAAYAPTATGTYRWVASYSGDANNLPSGGACNDPGESTVVTRAIPTITTAASPDIVLGAGTLTDNAKVTGRSNAQPGATVDFRLYGPDDANCSGDPVFQSIDVAYPATNGSVGSSNFTVRQAGTYRWIASYSGDANNAPAEGACNDADETTVVARATPTLATTASATITLGGGTLTDTATVIGASHRQAGATIEFNLYAPGDATCAGAPISTSTVAYPVAGGPVSSAAYTPTRAGTHRWVASYSGDANNAARSGACNDANESTVVTHAAPSIATTASPDITLGEGSLTDSATVGGRVEPQSGATVEFRLYGPGDPTCSATPIFTSTVPYPTGGGAVTSQAFTPVSAGTYRWIAAYSGDANNAAAAGACNAANETTVVGRAVPTITATASADVALGADARLTDAATVGGRTNPQAGATVDFRLYGPGDLTCTDAPVFASLNVAYPVGGGAVTSAAYTPTRPGTYRWVAAYSGDANNAPAAGTCGDSGQSTSVARAAATLTGTASADVTIGAGTLADGATVSGRVDPSAGATVDFRLYGPDDPTCTATPVFESLNVDYPVGGGAVTSGPFTPTATGTYRWVASYSGDLMNAPSAGACGAAGQTVTVAAVAPLAPIAPAAPTVPSPPTNPTVPIAPAKPKCLGRTATIVAIAGETDVTGTAGDDVIVGRSAGENIEGRGGNDTICAGGGNDTVHGGSGRDSLAGGTGKDDLFGDAGKDLLLGQAGGDDLRGGSGNDRMGGGAGDDRVNGGAGNDLLDEQELGGAGHDRLLGGIGRDRIRAADSTSDSINCGAGIDSAILDDSDRQNRCDWVRRMDAGG